MTPIPQPPPLRSRNGAGRFWIALSIFVLLAAVAVALIYAEEDWRGAREFAAVEKELASKGETLDWQRFIPPQVPDDQNLAMAPLFVRGYQYQIDPKTHIYTFGPTSECPEELAQMPCPGPLAPDHAPGGWDLARPRDLSKFQQYYRARADFPRGPQAQSPADDVLLALSRYTPVLDELARSAAERPLSRFPAVWVSDNLLATGLPRYTLQWNFVRTLALRASARLAASHAGEALLDLELSWRICRDTSKDRVLIAQVILNYCLNTTLSPMWEGLANRRWSAVELARLQADLQKFDLLSDYAAAFRGDRAFDLRWVDLLERQRDLAAWRSISFSPAHTDHDFLAQLGFDALPRGWFNFNKATDARFTQDYLLAAIDSKAHRFSRAKVEEGSSFLVKAPSYQAFLSQPSPPIYVSVSRRTVRLQTGVDEAVTACALERFFLDHQFYPSRLDELVPGYLDHVMTDIIDGAPLRYHSTPDGRYQLYGIGWNGRDDGGQVVRDSLQYLDEAAGDWVWQYAELPPMPPGK